ncbi:MAG: hypothetical protein WC919_06980 [Candidatus Paceibacterota bacterium]|jgi:hypothetical protein
MTPAEQKELRRLKKAAVEIIERHGMEDVIERLVDNLVSAFIDSSSTDRADIYGDLLRDGCVGYDKMTKTQLINEMATNFGYLVEEWEEEEEDDE